MSYEYNNDYKEIQINENENLVIEKKRKTIILGKK